jgi:hypothetical protein
MCDNNHKVHVGLDNCVNYGEGEPLSAEELRAKLFESLKIREEEPNND